MFFFLYYYFITCEKNYRVLTQQLKSRYNLLSRVKYFQIIHISHSIIQVGNKREYNRSIFIYVLRLYDTKKKSSNLDPVVEKSDEMSQSISKRKHKKINEKLHQRHAYYS